MFHNHWNVPKYIFLWRIFISNYNACWWPHLLHPVLVLIYALNTIEAYSHGWVNLGFYIVKKRPLQIILWFTLNQNTWWIEFITKSNLFSPFPKMNCFPLQSRSLAALAQRYTSVTHFEPAIAWAILHPVFTFIKWGGQRNIMLTHKSVILR